MKILHVYKDFDPPVRGGMERHMALMCRYQRQWADVQALICSRSLFTRTAERDGTQVVEVGEWGRFQSTPVAPFFPLHLRRLKADVTVLHVPNPNAEISWLLARPRGKLIVRYHSDIVRQATAMKAYGPLQQNFLAKADIILPTSQTYMDSSSTLRSLREKCRVVPLGIIAQEFQSPDPARVAQLKEQYGAPYVLFSGRHRYYKGLEYLVRAAGNINAKIVIAGEGPETNKLKSLAIELNTNIEFPGALDQDDLIAHLHGCYAFAFPSIERSEAFGISILEAHACAKPVVSTQLGTGVEFANLHDRTGLNVPPKDAPALAQALNRLLDDPELATRLGEQARIRVENEFDAQRVARQEFEIYQEISE